MVCQTQIRAQRATHRISSKQNDQNKKNSFFTDEELLELDELGLPEPATSENIRNISNCLQEA
jgi:hypothetical protein